MVCRDVGGEPSASAPAPAAVAEKWWVQDDINSVVLRQRAAEKSKIKSPLRMGPSVARGHTCFPVGARLDRPIQLARGFAVLQQRSPALEETGWLYTGLDLVTMKQFWARAGSRGGAGQALWTPCAMYMPSYLVHGISAPGYLGTRDYLMRASACGICPGGFVPSLCCVLCNVPALTRSR